MSDCALRVSIMNLGKKSGYSADSARDAVRHVAARHDSPRDAAGVREGIVSRFALSMWQIIPAGHRHVHAGTHVWRAVPFPLNRAGVNAISTGFRRDSVKSRCSGRRHKNVRRLFEFRAVNVAFPFQAARRCFRCEFTRFAPDDRVAP